MRPNVTTQIQRTDDNRQWRAPYAPEMNAETLVKQTVGEPNAALLMLAISQRLADVPNLGVTVTAWPDNFEVQVRTLHRTYCLLIQRKRATEVRHLDRAIAQLRRALETNEPSA